MPKHVTGPVQALVIGFDKPDFSGRILAELRKAAEAFEAAITPQTAAVVPVHLYGCPADMEAPPPGRPEGEVRRRRQCGRR